MALTHSAAGYLSAILLAVGLMTVGATPAQAAKSTACSKIAICYCVNDALKALIETKVSQFRERLEAERKAGKAVGYLSVPLSTVGGGFFNVNIEVATAAKGQIEKRFGAERVWVLNPGVPEAIADAEPTQHLTEHVAMRVKIASPACRYWF